MHDADDLECLDDGFFDYDTWMTDDLGDDEPMDESPRQQENYAILSAVDIQRRQEEDISQVSAVLSISRVASCILLHHYNWSISKVQDEWFADEPNVRNAVGLLEEPIEAPSSRELTCGICFEIYHRDSMIAAACGHRYCNECWKGYTGASVSEGPGCLALRCPNPSCSVAVGLDMINNLATDEDKEKYSRYLVRSYIEDNRNIKWCPSPGCEFAVDFAVDSESYDVRCNCSHSFCWNCTEEMHRPVDCETVAKWISKNSSEAENTEWILAYTKPCPKCNRPIEKNLGCMHMTCRPPCKFDFCWLCLGPWKEHRYCNRYKDESAENMRTKAKLSLERYAHYYERWASNRKSRQKALKDLRILQATGKLDKLREKQGLTESQVKFIIDAWLQIVECRRVLQWTYAYGYYIPEHEKAKREYFEYVQGEAEFGLERLHHCAEEELQAHLVAQTPKEGFSKFRVKLDGLTSVTRTYFENLVRALETGLQDICSADPSATSNYGIRGVNGRPAGRSETGTSSGPGGFIGIGFNDLWSCVLCSFVNPSTASICKICEAWWCDRCTYANPGSTSTCLMCSE